MKKKILSLILTLCMLLGLFPYAVLGTAALAADDSGVVHLYTAEDVLQLMNDKVNMAQTLREGDMVEVGFYSTVREFQTKAGKQMFAQENRCWKIAKA